MGLDDLFSMGLLRIVYLFQALFNVNIMSRKLLHLSHLTMMLQKYEKHKIPHCLNSSKIENHIRQNCKRSNALTV